MTRSEREHLSKRIVQHYTNIAKRKKKSITVNIFWPKIFHVKLSIVLFGSTMTVVL